MKTRISLTLILLLAGLGLWWGIRIAIPSENGAATPGKTKSRETNPAGTSDDPQAFRTKASTRGINGAAATHRPERLKDFMLPEVSIDRLDLDAALRKLLAAYQDSCRKTGETALDLKFAVPPGTDRKLHLRLGSRSFKSSVQLLATLSGMKVRRDGLEYRFEAIENERRTVNRNLDVPPDFQSALSEMCQSQGAKLPVRALLSRLGLELDPSTRLTLGPDGKLALETHSSADAAAVSALARTLEDQPPVQHLFTTKVLELAPDAKWTPPDLAQMDDSQLQLLMREMAQKQGTELMTLPSITTKSGQNSAIEIIRDFIAPTDETATSFEKHNIGKVMHVQGSALGFGHDLAFDYTDTTGSLDATTLKPVINKHTDVKDSGFSSDGGTRMVVQTRPDGSRAIVLLTSTLIDGTGRPVHSVSN